MGTIPGVCRMRGDAVLLQQLKQAQCLSAGESLLSIGRRIVLEPCSPRGVRIANDVTPVGDVFVLDAGAPPREGPRFFLSGDCVKIPPNRFNAGVI